ncbi:MAG: hypothetical protein JST86_07400 [Bacteroidetes bacterium]|nr:hypothetical protein [Bacteroidota bacterium]
MSSGIIIGWSYKNGELARRELDSWMAGIATIIGFALTFIVIDPALQTGIPGLGKIVNFILLLALLATVFMTYKILQLFSSTIFSIYRKIKNIKEQEILFTDNKITSTAETWILNSDTRKLTNVSFSSPHKKELIFKGTEQQPGKRPTAYTIHIPIPKEETGNAETICAYFTEKLAGKATFA